MSICLRHVEAIVRDQFFFTDFVFVYSEEGRVKDKLTQLLIPLFMANTMGKIVAPYCNLFVSYNRFCKRV